MKSKIQTLWNNLQAAHNEGNQNIINEVTNDLDKALAQ